MPPTREEEPQPRQPRRRRAPRNRALDGLRAFAIISIVAYHLSVPWLPSGHMGVVVFFVISIAPWQLQQLCFL